MLNASNATKGTAMSSSQGIESIAEIAKSGYNITTRHCQLRIFGIMLRRPTFSRQALDRRMQSQPSAGESAERS